MPSSLIKSVLNIRDLGYKLLPLLGLVLTLHLGITGYSDYKLREQTEKALSYALQYHRLVVEEYKRSGKPVTDIEHYSTVMSVAAPESIARLVISDDMNNATIYLQGKEEIDGKRLLLSKTDSHTSLQCQALDPINNSLLPKACRKRD